MNPYEELYEMLTYRRPAGSKSERKFISRFIRPLGVSQDPAGNLIKRIGDAPVMWSSHTDTVHRSGGRQLLSIKDGYIEAPNSTCLGADDTAGVWLMMQMIRRNVPGLYVFHREEECGGHGSQYIAKHTPALLDGIKYAIALDRKGEQSVVTHQWGGRCCSQDFAWALCRSLNLGMKPDDGGTFTDTANYMELVPECTNISVGYYGQHSASETLNVEYLFKLLDALVTLDTESLPAMRPPGIEDYGNDWDWAFPAKGKSDAPAYGTRHCNSYDALLDVVKRYPAEVADFLDQYGITVDEIMEQAGYDTPACSIS